MAAVEVHDIVKSYRKGAVQALHGVSFEAGHGEIFGIIGPDGAGKTSLFRILTTLILPDSGTASVDGLDIVRDYKAIRNCVGYMPGRFSLYQDMTVEENLTFFATVFGTTIRENYHLIKDIYSQIEPFKDRKAGALSGGMKQKLGLCCSLVHDPDLLILDDLGTEFHKQFYQSTVYNIINTRMNRDLPTIISTNLNHNEISALYDERITSRIYTTYTCLHFVGQDVRVLKKSRMQNG